MWNPLHKLIFRSTFTERTIPGIYLYTQNVMLVDDDEVTLELLQHILDEFVSGEIFAFSSSIKAINFIADIEPGRVDLIICDWKMPEADGFKVLKSYRDVDPEGAFLMLTGYATRATVLEAKKNGATDFIAKPFRNQELTDKIKRLLN